MWDREVICSHILTFLGETHESVDEYSLIKHLDGHGCFGSFQQEPANLQLFRKHFVTRHCLYTLQESLSSEWFLEIGMLKICLRQAEVVQSVGEQVSTQLNAADATLREYYLDLTNLEQADAAGVEKLLQGFWQRFAVQGRRSDALTTLELDDEATWAEIQIAYRRKAQRAHPDRGGSSADFAHIQEAYEALRKHFNK